MADKDQQPMSMGGDELERELNAELAKYASVGPRPGLEERVLASLRAERAQTSNRRWWICGVTAALATVIVVGAFVWRSGGPSSVITANHAKTGPRSPDKPATVASHNASNDGLTRKQRHGQRNAGRDGHSRIAAAIQPKLDQFPSPQPLSEQEKILKSYVAEYPDRAVLLARLRTEELQQDQLEEMTAPSSEDRHTNSERNVNTPER